MRPVFYERKIGSLRELVDEAVSMDADAGLRILGRVEGKNCYVFVTRFGEQYTAMFYERGPKRGARPGKRLAVEELGGIKELESMLKKVATRPVTAFAY